ncbi:unnamed protein product [Danaus chrysippus]|uniref:Decapping nuclease n=1 Tax=Danaus chrysippus TaxID=151541 RepID=A0A8J2R2B9_9NEOP|nr:unnamed protein product [Danaus chrysippus]
MAELLTHQSIYRRQFPNFGKPKIIGYIGLENLKYVQSIEEKNVNYDLNLGIEQAKRKPPDLDVKLTELLKFLLENERLLNLPVHNDLESAQFFCYRGLLTCIACTPYEKREPWKIAVILYKDKPDKAPDPSGPVDETEEFSLVFTTNLNRHKIVYGAEMDGIRCDQSHVSLPPSSKNPQEVLKYLSTKNFVELKTNRHIEFSRQELNFKKFKTIKWWCQSFLTGVETILCGCRNDSGIVEELKMYRVNDLPKISKKFWDPSVCFNFLDDFFTFVKRCLAREIKRKHGSKGLHNIQSLPMISLLFEWHPEESVHVSDYSHEDDPILFDWFLERYGKTST